MVFPSSGDYCWTNDEHGDSLPPLRRRRLGTFVDLGKSHLCTFRNHLILEYDVRPLYAGDDPVLLGSDLDGSLVVDTVPGGLGGGRESREASARWSSF